MKFLFYLRAFFICGEFFVIVASFILFIGLGKDSNPYLEGFTLSSETLNMMMMPTLPVAGWVFIGGQKVLFPDEKSNFFQQWPDFWKHQIHFKVGLFYVVILYITFGIVCLFDETLTYSGKWIFMTCYLCFWISAFSIYDAIIHIKTKLKQAKE